MLSCSQTVFALCGTVFLVGGVLLVALPSEAVRLYVARVTDEVSHQRLEFYAVRHGLALLGVALFSWFGVTWPTKEAMWILVFHQTVFVMFLIYQVNNIERFCFHEGAVIALLSIHAVLFFCVVGCLYHAEQSDDLSDANHHHRREPPGPPEPPSSFQRLVFTALSLVLAASAIPGLVAPTAWRNSQWDVYNATDLALQQNTLFTFWESLSQLVFTAMAVLAARRALRVLAFVLCVVCVFGVAAAAYLMTHDDELNADLHGVRPMCALMVAFMMLSFGVAVAPPPSPTTHLVLE